MRGGDKMSELEFIKGFSSLTIKSICEELGIARGNLYSGKSGKKNELKVALAIIKKVYKLIDEYNMEEE